jgi:hypothetical protein
LFDPDTALPSRSATVFSSPSRVRLYPIYSLLSRQDNSTNAIKQRTSRFLANKCAPANLGHLNNFFVLWEKEWSSTAQACIGGLVSFEKERRVRTRYSRFCQSTGRDESINIEQRLEIIKHLKRHLAVFHPIWSVKALLYTVLQWSQ